MISDDELWKILDAAITKAGGATSWSRDNGLFSMRGAVNDMWNGKRRISETVGKALGYKKVKAWVKKQK